MSRSERGDEVLYALDLLLVFGGGRLSAVAPAQHVEGETVANMDDYRLFVDPAHRFSRFIRQGEAGELEGKCQVSYK